MNTITLPRSVVEQALDALSNTGTQRGKQPTQFHAEGLAIKALRAALKQPNMGNPVSVPAGWKLVPVEPTIPMLHRADGLTCIDFAALGTDGAFDLDELKEIYRAMLAAAPQPPVVEQPQSVTDCHQSQPQVAPPGSTESAYQRGYLDGMAKGRRDAELEQPKGEQEPVGEAGSMPGTDGFTMVCFRASDVPVGTKLYTHPQPKREPLTDEEIKIIDDGVHFHEAPDWSLRFARAIEAAHGVKGRK